jgi:hypothetical protein
MNRQRVKYEWKYSSLRGGLKAKGAKACEGGWLRELTEKKNTNELFGGILIQFGVFT